MNADTVLSRLRVWLLLLASGLFIGTLLELFLIEHTEDPVQLIPFVLCGIGLLSLAIALLRQRRTALLTLRGCMIIIVGGGLFGVYEHVSNNIAFLLEIQPNATTAEVVSKALGGANPLLAPAMLTLAAVLALTATYYHPALAK
jgi:hypothetical protein